MFSTGPLFKRIATKITTIYACKVVKSAYFIILLNAGRSQGLEKYLNKRKK